MSFDYTSLNAQLTAFYGTLTDQVSIEALNGFGALNAAQITATAQVVATVTT